MVQIRKFSNGGGSPESSAKTYGKLFYDGREITVDDQLFYDWKQQIKNSSNPFEGQLLEGVINRLKNNQDVKYDSTTNTITTTGDWGNLQPYLNEITKNSTQNDLIKAKKTADKWARRSARRGGDGRHLVATGLQNIFNFGFQSPQQKEPETSKIKLFGSQNDFQYNTDDQGNITWANSPLNAASLNMLNEYRNLGTLSREDAFNKYDMTEDQYNQFMNWYNQYGQNFMSDENWNSFLNRIKTKQFGADDDELLTFLGWNNKQFGTKPIDKTTSTAHQYEGAGFDEDYLKNNNLYIRKGADGNVYLTQAVTDADGNVTYNPVTDIYNLMNMDWASNSPFKNGSIVGGRFYTQDETWNQNTDASRAMQAFRDVANLTNKDGTPLSPEQYRQALLGTGIIFAGMNNPSPFSEYYDPATSVLSGFEHITSPVYYANLSSQFNTPQGQKIISYINPNERDPKTGLYNTYYTLSNDPTHIFDNQEALQNYLNTLSITPAIGVRDTSQPISQIDKLQYDGKEYLLANKKAKVQEGDQIKNVDIYRGKDGNYYYFGANQKLYKIFNKDLLDKITKGEVISSDSWLNDAGAEKRSNIFHTIFGNPGIGTSNPVTYRPNQYDALLGFKQGGKIPVLQYGGLLANAATNVKKRTATNETVGTLHSLGNGPSTQDSSDKWANAATALDTASLGTSFIPVYGNIVGAATGLGGSVSRFVSDIKRDGYQGKDLGRFLANVGLDILTLIPFAGSAAKASKIAKTTKELAKTGKVVSKTAKNAKKVSEAATQAEKLLSTSDVLGNIKLPSIFKNPGEKATKIGRALEIGLPAWGTFEGAKAAIDATKDGEITSDELASIANGLVSGVLLKRGVSRALDRKALKALENKIGITSTPTQYSAQFKTSKGKDVTVTLTSEDLNALKGKRKKELLTELETKVRNQKGDLEKTGIKAEDLIDRFKLPMKNGVISGVNKNWNKLNLPKDKKLDVFNESALSNKQLAESLQNPNLDYWGKRAARAYQYGLSRNPIALQNIEQSTGKTLVSIPQRTFGGQGLRWTLTPATFRGRQMLTNMSSAGVKNLASAKNYIRNNVAPEQQEYWLDLLNNRSKEFNSLFKKLSALSSDVSKRNALIDTVVFKQGGKIVKAQEGLKLKTHQNIPLFDYSRSGITMSGDNSTADWTKTYGDSDFMRYRNYYIQNWDKDWFQPIKQAYLKQLEDNGVINGSLITSYNQYNPTSKSFVSVAPGSQNKSAIPEYDLSLADFKRLTQDKKLGWAHNLYVDGFEDILKSHPIVAPATTSSQTEPSSPRIESVKPIVDPLKVPETDRTIQTRPTVTPDSSTLSAGGLGGRPGEYIPKHRNWNPDTLIGGLELTRNLLMNSAMFRKLKDANVAVLKPYATEIYDRYQDNITAPGMMAANEKRQFFVPTSTDALTNYAMRQNNEDQAQQIELQTRLAASNAYSQFLDKDLAARRAYAEDRRETAFYNQQQLANKIMRDAQIDQGRMLANNQSISNWVMELRNRLYQDRMKSQQMQQQNDAYQGQLIAQAEMNEAMQPWRQRWADKGGKDSGYDSPELMWLTEDPTSYNTAYSNAQKKGSDYVYNQSNNYIDFFWNRLPRRDSTSTSTGPTASIFRPISAKKGTKTPTYQQHHNGPKPDEAIWIQRNKDTARALEKLHDAVIKLFMKSIS